MVIENYCGNDGELWSVLKKPLQVVCSGKIQPTLRETFSHTYSRNCFETVTVELQISCAGIHCGVCRLRGSVDGANQEPFRRVGEPVGVASRGLQRSGLRGNWDRLV